MKWIGSLIARYLVSPTLSADTLDDGTIRIKMVFDIAGYKHLTVLYYNPHTGTIKLVA